MSKFKADDKWVTRLRRETERKVYFYLALVMSALWFLTRFVET